MVIDISLCLVAGALLLLLLADLANGASRKLEKMKQDVEPRTVANNPTVHTPQTSENTEKPRSRWVVGLSVLAFLLMPVLPVILFLNSFILSLSLSAFIPQGIPLFTLTVGAWARDIFITDILAFMIAVLQGVGGAVWLRCVSLLHEDDIGKGSRAVIRRVNAFAVALILIALLVEFGATLYRGLLLMDVYNAIISGLQALVTGFGDVVLGALVIDFLFVPIVVGIVGGIRRVSSWLTRSKVPDLSEYPTYPTGLRALAFIDRTMMDRLRALDERAGRLVGIVREE